MSKFRTILNKAKRPPVKSGEMEPLIEAVIATIPQSILPLYSPAGLHEFVTGLLG